jgi:alkylhydroperoxidase family enzyme
MDELGAELRALLAPRVERLGYLGDFFRYSAHQPEALGHFIRYTEALKGALPDDLVETVALTAATVLGNDYERNQHERLCVALGFGQEWVRAVEHAAASGDTSGLAPEVAVCSAYVRSAVLGVEPRGEFAALVAAIGEAPAVGVVLTAARYAAHALVVRTFGITAPVASIFDAGSNNE